MSEVQLVQLPASRRIIVEIIGVPYVPLKEPQQGVNKLLPWETSLFADVFAIASIVFHCHVQVRSTSFRRNPPHVQIQNIF